MNIARLHVDNPEFDRLVSAGWRVISIGNRIALLMRGPVVRGFDSI